MSVLKKFSEKFSAGTPTDPPSRFDPPRSGRRPWSDADFQRELHELTIKLQPLLPPGRIITEPEWQRLDQIERRFFLARLRYDFGDFRRAMADYLFEFQALVSVPSVNTSTESQHQTGEQL